MSKGSFKKTNDPNFKISNNNLIKKREAIAIAKSRGMTYSQWCRSLIFAGIDAASPQERSYSEDED